MKQITVFGDKFFLNRFISSLFHKVKNMLNLLRHKIKYWRYVKDEEFDLMLASHKSLAKEWLSPEDEEAWAYLQNEKR
jgi:hypothetical protein